VLDRLRPVLRNHEIITRVNPPKILNMKRYFEQKTVSNSVQDVSTTTRKVKVAISQMGSKDFDNDVIDHNAYTKTLTERGPKGANLIWHLTDHNPSLKSAIGKFSELYVEKDYLVGITDVPNTTWGNDVLEFYKSGHINQHSVGFRTIKQENQKSVEGEYNLIKEILLFEGSAVLWGANINTPTIEVGKSTEEVISQHEKLSKELSMLLKSLKDGRFSDEAFEFIEIRVAQINEAIKSLISIESTPKVEEPAEAVPETKEPEIDLSGLKHNLNNLLTKLNS
jgi:HK97 family phage prohead protease